MQIRDLVRGGIVPHSHLGEENAKESIALLGALCLLYVSSFAAWCSQDCLSFYCLDYACFFYFYVYLSCVASGLPLSETTAINNRFDRSRDAATASANTVTETKRGLSVVKIKHVCVGDIQYIITGERS